MIATTCTDTPKFFGDRRIKFRYPIKVDVQYRIGDAKGPAGAGRTVNIGSAGMLFTAEHRIAVGQKLELSLSWPAMLDGVTRLKLVATGIAVRYAGSAVAIRMLKHEFRIRASRQIDSFASGNS